MRRGAPSGLPCSSSEPICSPLTRHCSSRKPFGSSPARLSSSPARPSSSRKPFCSSPARPSSSPKPQSSSSEPLCSPLKRHCSSSARHSSSPKPFCSSPARHCSSLKRHCSSLPRQKRAHFRGASTGDLLNPPSAPLLRTLAGTRLSARRLRLSTAGVNSCTARLRTKPRSANEPPGQRRDQRQPTDPESADHPKRAKPCNSSKLD